MTSPIANRSDRSEHPSPRRLEEAAFAPPSQIGSDNATLSHIESCPLCASKIEALRNGRASFLKENPAEAFLEAVEARAESRRREWSIISRKWIPLAAAASAALCLSVVYLIRSGGEPGADDFPGVSLKGGASAPVSLELFVSRNGSDALPWNEQEPLHPKDVLKFGVKSAEDGFAMIANIDDRGRVSLYHPLDNAPPSRVFKGKDAILKDSIFLDNFVGREVIVTFVSKKPLDFKAVKIALERAYREAKGDMNRLSIKDIDAEVSFMRIVKVAP